LFNLLIFKFNNRHYVLNPVMRQPLSQPIGYYVGNSGGGEFVRLRSSYFKIYDLIGLL